MKLVLLVEEYLDHCRHTKKLSEHSLRAYDIDLKEWMRFARPSRCIGKCSRGLIKDYVRYLFEDRGLKEASVKRRIACLKAMFRWLEMEDRIDENPFRRMSLRIRLPSALPKSLPRHEIRRLMRMLVKRLGFVDRASCRGDLLFDAVRDAIDFSYLTTLVAVELLFVTGIRIGELTGLQLQDLDLRDGNIRIRGKGNRERVVFLPCQDTRDLVKTYLKLRQQRCPTGNSLLVLPQGRPANSQYLRQKVRVAGQEAGLSRKITPHMLRHTTATELLNNGVDIRFVQKLLGHQSITTTQIYTQISDAALKRAIKKGHPMKGLIGAL